MVIETYVVEGMSCSACAGHVTKALGALDGVKTVTVSLPSKSAQIEYEPSKVSPVQLSSAVAEEGYTLGDRLQ